MDTRKLNAYRQMMARIYRMAVAKGDKVCIKLIEDRMPIVYEEMLRSLLSLELKGDTVILFEGRPDCDC